MNGMEFLEINVPLTFNAIPCKMNVVFSNYSVYPIERRFSYFVSTYIAIITVSFGRISLGSTLKLYTGYLIWQLVMPNVGNRWKYNSIARSLFWHIMTSLLIKLRSAEFYNVCAVILKNRILPVPYCLPNQIVW